MHSLHWFSGHLFSVMFPSSLDAAPQLWPGACEICVLGTSRAALKFRLKPHVVGLILIHRYAITVYATMPYSYSQLCHASCAMPQATLKSQKTYHSLLCGILACILHKAKMTVRRGKGIATDAVVAQLGHCLGAVIRGHDSCLLQLTTFKTMHMKNVPPPGVSCM